jgi:hypothetical protein
MWRARSHYAYHKEAKNGPHLGHNNHSRSCIEQPPVATDAVEDLSLLYAVVVRLSYDVMKVRAALWELTGDACHSRSECAGS